MPEEKYKVIFGVTKETFEKMLEILESAYRKMHQQGGSPSRLSVLDKLVVMLGYYHDYRTMENIAFDYDVSKSRICDAISWVEETLIKDGTFALPSKREMLKSNNKISVAIIDVTECEIERPKKTKTILFWKEKKRHTLKDQVVINGETGEIIDVFEDKGSVHDFEIFKKSKFRLPGNVLLLAGKAYQGLYFYHSNSLVPFKKPKFGQLSLPQKKFNSFLSKFRIFIEHVNRTLECFKILQFRYRNKLKKHFFRFSLISGIFNFQL